jgi:hypothetical protein
MLLTSTLMRSVSFQKKKNLHSPTHAKKKKKKVKVARFGHMGHFPSITLTNIYGQNYMEMPLQNRCQFSLGELIKSN